MTGFLAIVTNGLAKLILAPCHLLRRLDKFNKTPFPLKFHPKIILIYGLKFVIFVAVVYGSVFNAL
jgi:hypothetical protein